MPTRIDRTADRPLVCILDGSVDITGALMAARREAALLADKARFMIVLPESSRTADADLPEFERIVRLPIVHLRKDWKDALRYLPALVVAGHRLAQLLHETRCTRLQVNDFYLMQGAAARLFGFTGRIATWVRIDPRHYGGFMSGIWLGRAETASDRVVAVSRFIQSALPPEMAATLLYDPAPDVTPIGADPASRRFVFVGNYIEGKGQEVAIAAFHRIAAAHPEAELIFHGGDMGLPKNRDYRARLEQIAGAGTGEDRIQFGDFADPASAFAGKLAALNCSRSESFSLACLEASAHGLPVIATDSGGPREVVDDGETGYLIPVGDCEVLADRMVRLLADPQAAVAMGRRGAKRVRSRFSPEAFRQGAAEILGL